MQMTDREERFLVAVYSELEKGQQAYNTALADEREKGAGEVTVTANTSPQLAAAWERATFADPYVIGGRMQLTDLQTHDVVRALTDSGLLGGSRTTNGRLVGIQLNAQGRIAARTLIENATLPRRARAIASSGWVSGVVGGIVSGLIVAYAAWRWGWTK